MEIRTTTPRDSPPFQRNLKNKNYPTKDHWLESVGGFAGLAQSWLEQPSYKRCLSWVRIPDPALQDDMLILNILDDISNREFKIALVTPGLVWKNIKRKKEVPSTVLYAKMVEQKLPGL